jgi:hypothetical protein
MSNNKEGRLPSEDQIFDALGDLKRLLKNAPFALTSNNVG